MAVITDFVESFDFKIFFLELVNSSSSKSIASLRFRFFDDCSDRDSPGTRNSGAFGALRGDDSRSELSESGTPIGLYRIFKPWGCSGTGFSYGFLNCTVPPT